MPTGLRTPFEWTGSAETRSISEDCQPRGIHSLRCIYVITWAPSPRDQGESRLPVSDQMCARLVIHPRETEWEGEAGSPPSSRVVVAAGVTANRWDLCLGHLNVSARTLPSVNTCLPPAFLLLIKATVPFGTAKSNAFPSPSPGASLPL